MSTNHPPPLSILDRLLVARIDIPDDAVVAEIVFVPDSSTPIPDALEHARRRVLTLSASSSIFDVILPSVQPGHHPQLFLFAIALNDRAQIITTLNDLRCDGLIAPVPASYFPFRELHDRPRDIQSHFLNAVRNRLIDHLVVANPGLQRCKDGFLIYHHQATSATDWGMGWEYKALSRPLIFCHLQLQPSTSSVVLHPTLLPTPYLPLASSLPLPPCSPILLLPYATPAYFLATYSGPTSALIRLFSESLKGLGQPDPGASFIIGWISVENKQGEDKGIVFIYPTRLCLAFVPSLNRPLLVCTPDLPAPLQPSPRLQSAITPLSERFPTYPNRPSLFGSPTTELNAFRALTLSKSKNIRTIAAQVSSYVDHIAKDRERERERLKREREGATTSPSLTPRSVPVASTSLSGPSASQASVPMSSRPIPLPSQTFYPSPPQADSSSTISITGNTSPVLPVGSRSPAQPSSVQNPPTLATSSSSFDSFGYLGMNMDDMSMDFGMDMFSVGMNLNLGGSSSTNSATTRTAAGYNGSGQGVSLSTNTGMEFDDFTDDDFNFFDQPSTHASAPAPPPPPPPVSQAPPAALSFNPTSSLLSPPSFADIQSSGPGPPQLMSNASSTPAGHAPWSMNFPEGFTPCSVENLDSVVPPDLMLSSPGVSSSDTADGWPLTPGIHVDASVKSHGFDLNTEDTRKTSFDPIPFANYHRLADGKYAPKGKFGLLSPPPEEEDSTVPTAGSGSPVDTDLNTRSKKSTNTGWRTRYNAATDPRVGVMRKLIGVKRKNTIQGGRFAKISHWNTEHEDWKKFSISSFEDDQLDSEQSSDEESHFGDELSEEEDTPITSRPSTPPPAYLPLGPTLLHTHFHHCHLFPLSTPLRPSGSSIPLTNYTSDLHAGSMMLAANVPTPVSPAALLGQSDEKLKTLELVVSFLAKEAVENLAWGETWLASNAFASSNSNVGALGRRKLTEVWASDVKLVENAFNTLEYLHGGMTIGEIFGLDSANSESLGIGSDLLQVMDTPKIVVGKGDAIIRILPTALRFWEKLGLGPQCGGKDATVYVLYPDDGERHRQSEIENWLSSVCTAFETKHLGKLSRGTGPHCTQAGLVPVKFDVSFRKTFTPFIANFSTVKTPIILFLVIPAIHMNVSSQALRQVLSLMRKALKSSSFEDRIVIQLIPEHLIRYMECEPSTTQQLEALCINLYDRIPTPIDRPFARSFTPEISSIPVRTYIRKPIFTIARPLYHKVTYARSIHASLDVMDRYTLLHVGYRLSACGKWLVVACIDQRGEAWDQAVYLLKSEQQDMDNNGHPASASTPASASWYAFTTNQEETNVVKQVWEFVLKFAKRADIEWRIVISKLGIMVEAELAAWMEFLATNAPTCGLGSVHISLISADPDSSLMFTKLQTQQHTTPPTGKYSSSNKSILFTDISSKTYALFPNMVLPMPIPPTQSDIGLTVPCIADLSGGTGARDPETEANSPANTVNGVSTGTFTKPPILTSTDSGPHTVGLLPKSTTCLIRVPSSPPLTSISMLHIHLLHVHCYPSQTGKADTWDTKQLHADITRNFYELSMLAKSKWKMSLGMEDGGISNLKLGYNKSGANPMLPLHLAMVDIMGQVVDNADTLETDS